MTQINRRQFLISSSVLTITPVLSQFASAQQSTINWSATRNDGNDFFRAPVLLTGKHNAILVDGSFNFQAGEQLVAQIKASGKKLTTIYISCADPDYYFSLKPVKAAFPDVRILAATSTINAINDNVQKKIDTWGPQLGEFGPQSLDDIVFAEAYDESSLELEGVRIEIVTSKVMHDRRYLWVPSIDAVFGGVYGFAGLHVWTADTPNPEDRAAWVRELEQLIDRNPKIVVAGHAASGANNGPESLVFTRDYLLAYEKQVALANNSKELIAAMQSLYPDLGLMPALEIGAQVAKGELDWR